MKIKWWIVLLSLVAIAFLSAWRYTDDSSESKRWDSETPQSISAVELKSEYNFAGEKLPLDRPDVLERLDREIHVNTFWHSSTLLNIKRSARYFKTIERILAEEGVPDDFKYLSVAESNLTQAVSPAGATGFWQFLNSTGKSYGLEVNDYVDERYNIEKSTRAACQYLKEAKQKFGSWTLAAASYNMGMNGLQRRLDSQLAHNYYDLNLSQETMRYVFRIVALKEIISDPKRYGINIEPHQYYMPKECYTLKVDTAINSLSIFGQKYGISYRELKYFNPWLVGYKLPAKSKTYIIQVPK